MSFCIVSRQWGSLHGISQIECFQIRQQCSSAVMSHASSRQKANWMRDRKVLDSSAGMRDIVTSRGPLQLHPSGRILPSRGFFGFGRQTAPDIVQAGDPVLHEPTKEVVLEEIQSDEVQRTIDNMIAAMRAAPGVGLSANQIGIPLRIIVLEDTEEYIRMSDKKEVEQQQRAPFSLQVVINPTLTPKGNSKARFFEGCLSVSGYRAMVERFLHVEVTGFDREAKPLRIEARGWQARIFQHECDHLDGFLYVDKMIPRSFRTLENLRIPLPTTCPQPGPVTLRE